MCLEEDAPSENPFTLIKPYCYDAIDVYQCNPIVNATVFSNDSTKIHLITFDLYIVQLYVDTCVTSGLTGFASDFIPRSYNNTTTTKTNTFAGEFTIVGQVKASYTFLDEKGYLWTISTIMSYSPQSKTD